MTLTPGSRLGSYEVLAKIGEGGMGEVYRARDTRLNRDVALKVLPDSFATDPERLARFTREAQTLASLNHPNIAHIHGLEESGGVRALVMELVEGDDLSQRIARGAIPLDEALPIAKQIAEALEAAHEQGIIHRDLKPANIKVRSDGTVKVLDFGLAKATEPAGSSPGLSMSPTITTPAMTQAGMILGTAVYMSPEQARGKTVDRRADLWAFGAVLYEMLTGTRAFEGEDIADTLGNVLKVEPDWKRCPASIPPRVIQVLRGCLQKNPKQRIDSAQDVRLALEGAFETAAPQMTMAASSSGPHGRLAWLVAAGAVAGMVALVVPAVRHLRESAPVQEIYRFPIAPPPGMSFTTFRLSPDGRYVAYIAAGAGATGGSSPGTLWIRALESLESRQIPGSDGSTYPFWSPDSASVGFFQAGKLKKVAVDGGPVQTICAAANARGGAWGPDDTILFEDGPGTPISKVPSSGAKPAAAATRLTGGDPGEGHKFPEFLPDGQHFLFDSTSNNPDNVGIFLGALDGSAPVHLLPDDSSMVFAQGHLFFLRDGTLMALPFDPARRTATADAFPVAEDVAIAANVRYGAFSLAGNGALAYWSGGAANTRELVWMDRTGKRVSSLGEPRAFGTFALSPDEKKVVAMIGGLLRTDLWLVDSASGLSTTFTFGSNAGFPVWSADGKSIVYARRTGIGNAFDIVRKPIMGSAEDVLLAQTANAFPSDVSIDGKSIVYTLTVAKRASDIRLLAADGDHQDSPYLSSPANERQPRFSPDGKWMAYSSDETGPLQVYVQTIPEGKKFMISTSGGTYPAWRRDGKELYYLDPDGKLMAVPVNINGASFEYGAQRVLFSAPGVTFFAVTRDGQRFLMNVPAGGESAAAGPPLIVVTNWRAGLKK